ncbi:MAG: hypothetical protein D6820_14390 [Lentisphaerae bacterium]|nr:MAG: hypothetical protein D6820_14390 [Lentisphaerota bacterium]
MADRFPASGRFRRRRGQTLIYMLLLMLILLVIVIFMFDLQNFVRLRERSQNSVDAAVLTAAMWQGRTLNMVGELNLVKASTLLVDTIEPVGDTSAEALLQSDQVITQMQTRLLYVGPLLGYISAQQAAKNNRLRSNPELTVSLSSHITNNLEEIDGYPSLYEQAFSGSLVYNGYAWLEPYKEMLNRLVAEGLAVKVVNTRYLGGIPTLQGPGAQLLSTPAFYNAVWAHDYCWFMMMGISPDDIFDFSSIQLVSANMPFFPGSEFLNPYVSFERFRFPDADAWNSHVQTFQPYLDSRGMTPLPDDQEGLENLTWAIYDNSERGWADATLTDPNPNSGTYAFVGQYMRSPFRSEFVYGGAAARMFCEVSPSILSGRWTWRYGQDKSQEKVTSLGDALSGGERFNTNAKRLKEAESRLRQLGERASVTSSAAAKPFGKLGTEPPYTSGIVLPVFEQVRLIPAALVFENSYDRNYHFFQFITEYFGDPNYPDVPDDVVQKYWYYTQAIEMFLDHDSSFHKGWESYYEWHEEYMLGEDGVPNSGDEPRDPCLPPVGRGGGGGGSPPGGPSILH